MSTDPSHGPGSGTSTRPQLSIVIVNWNGADMLDRCLASVARSITPELHAVVVVVDNGSSDRSLEVIHRYSSDLPIRLIALPHNVGFAGGVNAAIAAQEAELHLLLNNDAELTAPLATAITIFAADPSLGIAQGVQYSADGTQVDSLGSLMTQTGFLFHLDERTSPTTATTTRSIFSVKGAAMWVRGDVWTSAGLFDPDSFAYFEESDLCWRAQLLGWRVSFIPELPPITHIVGATSTRLGASIYEFHSYKNRLRSILVNTGPKRLPMMLVRHLLVCGAAAIGSMISRRHSGAIAIARALAWNLRSMSRTLERRRKVQRLRVKSDGEVFESTFKKVSLKELRDLGRAYEAGFEPRTRGATSRTTG